MVIKTSYSSSRSDLKASKAFAIKDNGLDDKANLADYAASAPVVSL